MNRLVLSVMLGLALLLGVTLAVSGGENEDASDAGCLPRREAVAPQQVCITCHLDGMQRWETRRQRACTPYCMTCHQKAQMSRHHKVNVALEEEPEGGLMLTADHHNACFTCHDLAQPRYDRERWKAASLYERMFHKQPRYKTYFLVQRNDNGQLCMNCH